jgi:hypothetical protein
MANQTRLLSERVGSSYHCILLTRWRNRLDDYQTGILRLLSVTQQ